MKKIFSLLLALMMVFSLAACGGNDGDKTSSKNDTTSNSSGQSSDTSDIVQTWETKDEYIAALIEFIKADFSGDSSKVPIVPIDDGSKTDVQALKQADNYTENGFRFEANGPKYGEGCPTIMIWADDPNNSDYYTRYTYIGHYNQDALYEQMKKDDYLSSRVIEWNDELKCYVVLLPVDNDKSFWSIS